MILDQEKLKLSTISKSKILIINDFFKIYDDPPYCFRNISINKEKSGYKLAVGNPYYHFIMFNKILQNSKNRVTVVTNWDVYIEKTLENISSSVYSKTFLLFKNNIYSSKKHKGLINNIKYIKIKG